MLYKCEIIGGNTKLAQRESDRKTLIETRGEGGFIIVAPSSGKVNKAGDYILKAGGFASIATITPDEREQLHTLARTFDEIPRPAQQQYQRGIGNRPGDEFNRTHTWPQILEPAGWVQVFKRNGTIHWRRPGKDEGVSVTTGHGGNDLLWVFSTSAQFEPERSYDKFGAHVLLNYQGDFKAATRALGSGYSASHGTGPYADYTTGKQQDDPQPLFKTLAPALPFPMDALGSIGAANAMQRIIKAPDAICGQSIIAALAQIAQGYADISIDGRRRPLSCFFVSVGETGERKSAVDEVATWPHREHERELEQAYKQDYAEWEREHTAWKLARDEGLKKAKGMQGKNQHLKEMGEAPLAPAQPVVLIEEPTYEGLIKILQHGQPSVGLFTDEGGRFVGGHAMNSENALKTAAGISSLWDRGEAKRTRSGDGHSTIYGKRLSMHLMLQGVVAEMLMSNDIFREQGWLSRVLMTWPQSTVGNRTYVAENVFSDPAVKRYHATCLSLLAKPLPVNDGLELNPPILELSSQAKRLWVPFHDYCDKEAGAGGELETVRGLANKAPEHAARLAGVLSVMRGATTISAEELEAGITLLNYYLNEAIRIADTGQLNQELRDAAALLDWLKKKKHNLIYPVLIYQKAPIRKLREKKTAIAAIEVLEKHGWLHRTEPMEVDGKRRGEVWRLSYV